MGRTATGVRGMTLSQDDEVIGMICMRSGTRDDVLVVSEQGMGKRSALEDYRVTNRGGKGVKTINITPKTGKLIAIKNVNDDNDLVIINKSGIAIRLRVSSLRVMGRATQGVRLINLEKKNDEIASVCKVDTEPESTDEESVRDAFNEDGGIQDVQDIQSEQDDQQNDNE
jgi:DNA gyrase subunit A